MSVVTLLSGGLDSALMAALIKENGMKQRPLFIDYGQKSANKELESCQNIIESLNLPKLRIARVPGYGKLIKTGLTNNKKDVLEDAFTPCRNSLFLLLAISYAYQMKYDSVAIGLLSEDYSIFPDQTKMFIDMSESYFGKSVGYNISILTPLMEMSKSDVVRLSKAKKICGTYSCHTGDDIPCGECIACREYIGAGV